MNFLRLLFLQCWSPSSLLLLPSATTLVRKRLRAEGRAGKIPSDSAKYRGETHAPDTLVLRCCSVNLSQLLSLFICNNVNKEQHVDMNSVCKSQESDFANSILYFHSLLLEVAVVQASMGDPTFSDE